MELAITALDPADDAAIDEAIRLLDAARRADLPDLPEPCRHWLAGALRFPRKTSRVAAFVAHSGDTMVGYMLMWLPVVDNLENSDLEITVHPEYRRRGIGRAMHAYAIEFLKADGRKRTTGMTVETLPGRPERDGAGAAFAAAMGASNALGEVRRRLDLSTVDSEMLDKMLAEAKDRAAGYRVVRWRDRVPHEYAADVAYLDSRMITDAPLGDIKWEPEKIDVERIREGEDQRLMQGIRSYSTGIVHEESGRLVSLTAIGTEKSVFDHGWQWITIVEPNHRGHRLGTIAKIENLWYALEHEPGFKVIDTWNAAVNKHMIQINEAMGFRAVDSWVNWQLEF
jgi:GNAT superfamily N-acetyltransferase